MVSVGNWWKDVRGGVYACGKGVWVRVRVQERTWRLVFCVVTGCVVSLWKEATWGCRRLQQ